MHYFIALDFDSEACEKFHDYAKSLNVYAEKARTVNNSHIHLTLSFLGELKKDEVDQVKQIVNMIEQSHLTLKFDNVSYFDPSRGGRIVWIGPTDNIALKDLQTRLTEALSNAGFTLDDRPFTPHVTLARGVRINLESFNDFKENFEPFIVSVQSMSLMLSSFEDGKHIHTPIVKKSFTLNSS